MLRERIASGRLRPGDRAPSTRAIMRDHAVAMGTATRVLALLQADGLVDSAPGRGSVVRSPDRARAADPTRADVLTAAIAIADAESLPAVSMRRLAAVLELPTMAVYRFVDSREDLESAMLDRVLGDLELPDGQQDWRLAIEGALRAVWSAMTAHPWLAGALSMTRPEVLPNAMPLSEHLLGALRSAGLEPVAAFTEYLCLLNLVRGLGMNVEPELADRADTGMTNDEWMDTRVEALRAAAPADRYPAMAEMLAHTYPYDADVLFETAVTRYLDGLAAAVTSLRS